MVKLRLWGTSEEVQEAVDYFSKLTGIKILQQSKPYVDGGKSVYCRVYLDVKLCPEAPQEKVNEILEIVDGEGG